jgi:hypothetical protein
MPYFRKHLRLQQFFFSPAPWAKNKSGAGEKEDAKVVR